MAGGFSFLVSPQTQEQSRQTVQLFKDAYDRETADARALEAQRATDRRQAALQAAYQQRAAEHDRTRFLLQAQEDKQKMDRIEQQNDRRDLRAFSLDAVKTSRDLFTKLMEPVTKQIEALDADRENRFDPTWKASVVPQMRAAQVKDYEVFENGIQSFISNHQEGDAPHIDFNSMKSLQLTAALANPDYVNAVQTRTANMRDLMAVRHDRLNIYKQKAERETHSTYDKKLWDNYIGADTYVGELEEHYSDYIRQHPGATPETDASLRLIEGDLGRARTGLAVVTSQFKSAALQGRFGPSVQSQAGTDEGIAPQQFLTTPEGASQSVTTQIPPPGVGQTSGVGQTREIQASDDLLPGLKNVLTNPPRSW